MPNELVKFSDVHSLNTASGVLEYVKDRLLRQGQPSENPGYGTCKYRQMLGDTQLACAIGMVIPDAEYYIAMDKPGMSVRTMLDIAGYMTEYSSVGSDRNIPVSEELLSLVRRVQSVENWTEDTTVDFFSRLQAMHDVAQGLTGAKFGYKLAQQEVKLKKWLAINSQLKELEF